MDEEISDKCMTSGIPKEECITSRECDCANFLIGGPQPVYSLIDGKMVLVPGGETTGDVERRWNNLLMETYQND